jgi:FkbM family methyltransferase
MKCLYDAMILAGVSNQKSLLSERFGLKTVLALLSDTDLPKNIYLYGNEDSHSWTIPLFVDTARKYGFAVKGICFINRPETDEVSYCGVEVISESEIKPGKDTVAVVFYDAWAGLAVAAAVVKGIQDKGFKPEQTFILFDLYLPQYFDREVMIPSENEIFVDAGVCDMSTSVDFITWCGGSYSAIYAFEPEPNQYRLCEEILGKNPALTPSRIHLYRAGLSSETAKLRFNPFHPGASRVDPSGTEEIEAVSLDEVLRGGEGEGGPVTFIKMDIEGSELEALKGARNTIIKWRPRLAICVYHKPEDILEIPAYILDIAPWYKMYIRHYSTTQTETVLLCVP